MFYGEYRHTIDEKSRLFIPSKFRITLKEKFIEKFYVTRGLDKCLFVFTENEWNVLTQKFKELPITQKNLRSFARLFFSGAYEATCDKQGRIIVPANLTEYAGIQKDVLVIGVSNRFEIWDQKTWESFSKDSLDSYEKIAEELVNLGI